MESIDWPKRIKSFFIIIGSLALSSVIIIVPTVQFADFVGYIHQMVLVWGVPEVVWALVAAFVAQVWFQWRNSVNLAKAQVQGARAISSVELY